ncbi:hypothetical protein [Bacteroides timonensis]|uniref:hypothetical protein n=1 Tax=Bacteroides timonensis TaxID=1470345 RepID=UPI0004AEDBDD|nr:hypothetical protein [Bacteroides timonensis]
MNPNKKMSKELTVEEWSMVARAVMSLIVTSNLAEIPKDDMKLVKWLTAFCSDINQEIIELSFHQ